MENNHEICVFKTVNQTLQWKANIFQPKDVEHHYKFFSPDSQTLVFLIHGGGKSHEWMQLQYNADTGTKIDEKFLSGVSPRVAHFNWMLENYSDGAGVGIPLERFYFEKSGEGIRKGKEVICRTSANLEWREQAQIGGTHLFLATAKRGVVVLNLLPKVGEDAFRRWRFLVT